MSEAGSEERRTVLGRILLGEGALDDDEALAEELVPEVILGRLIDRPRLIVAAAKDGRLLAVRLGGVVLLNRLGGGSNGGGLDGDGHGLGDSAGCKWREMGWVGCWGFRENVEGKGRGDKGKEQNG